MPSRRLYLSILGGLYFPYLITEEVSVAADAIIRNSKR
jgi:hypothetical protein